MTEKLFDEMERKIREERERETDALISFLRGTLLTLPTAKAGD